MPMTLLTHDEFMVELAALAETLPLLKKLTSGEKHAPVMREGRVCTAFTWENLTETLKRDAYKRLGLEPVTMYRRIEKSATPF